jgi:ABC-type glutathione transport system ATPase component
LIREPPPLLSVEDLSVTFGTATGPLRAVKGVSFTLAEAETLALVGESGCGKSATALAVMGLLPMPPAEVGGRVRFEGQNLLGLDDDELREIRGRQVSMVFQDPMSSLNPVRTIGRQMQEMLQVHLKMTGPRRCGAQRSSWTR